jgi:glycosyltransferase involved in cell wall biosynthesis
MGERARFVGYRSGDDLADHYAAADLFAFTSLTETFGNVVLEAMASGLPVVALRAGGVGDIIQPGLNGFALPPDQPPGQFARTLVELLDDAELRGRMSRAARTYAEGQSWDAVMSLIRERYRRIVALGAPAGAEPALASG